MEKFSLYKIALLKLNGQIATIKNVTLKSSKDPQYIQTYLQLFNIFYVQTRSAVQLLEQKGGMVYHLLSFWFYQNLMLNQI